jgi:hypothetical protein
MQCMNSNELDSLRFGKIRSQEFCYSQWVFFYHISYYYGRRAPKLIWPWPRKTLEGLPYRCLMLFGRWTRISCERVTKKQRKKRDDSSLNRMQCISRARSSRQNGTMRHSYAWKYWVPWGIKDGAGRLYVKDLTWYGLNFIFETGSGNRGKKETGHACVYSELLDWMVP